MPSKSHRRIGLQVLPPYSLRRNPENPLARRRPEERRQEFVEVLGRIWADLCRNSDQDESQDRQGGTGPLQG